MDYLNDIRLKFDELNVLANDIVNAIEPIENKEKKIDTATDLLEDILIAAYMLGYEHVSEMLGISITIDVDLMHDALYEVIQGETFPDRVRTHIDNNDMDALYLLIGDEYHRVYAYASEDAARAVQNKGYEVFKTWVTMGDDKVRDTHRYIDMQTISIDSEWYTYDGDHATRPGGFEKAQNNCGCRCVVLYTRI